jgi:thioredoxin 1
MAVAIDERLERAARRAAVMSLITVISDPQFDAEVISTPEAVLIYFWAPWCGPCRLMSPIMETIASNYGDRLKIVKIEVDPNPQAVAQCNVQGVPALVLFQSGQQVDTIEGVIGKPKIQDFLSQHLPQSV